MPNVLIYYYLNLKRKLGIEKMEKRNQFDGAFIWEWTVPDVSIYRHVNDYIMIMP